MSKKTNWFKARLSDKELEVLEKNCKNLGISKSEFFRLSCCTLIDRETSLCKDEILQLKGELRRVGVNLNQVARKLNKGEEYSKLGLLKQKYLNPFEEIMEKINKILK